MATDSFNIYLSPVGVKSLNRFVINWQAGAKLIRHAHEYNGFVTKCVNHTKRHDVFKGIIPDISAGPHPPLTCWKTRAKR